jgi:hypothetical protein
MLSLSRALVLAGWLGELMIAESFSAEELHAYTVPFFQYHFLAC